jgi:uncharacterized integral membrane protein
MFTIILIILFGIFFGFFATQNSTHVTVNLGGHLVNQIPLYFVILVSLTIGMLIIGFIYLFRNLSARFTLGKKKSELKNTKEEVVRLNKEIHQLQLENMKLKTESGSVDEDSI